jgi:hypothetical protein
MIDANLFIGAVIVAIVQAIKYVAPGVTGTITILVAMVVGGLTAALAPHIGISPITVAMGVLDGLAAVGVHTVVSNAPNKS